MKLNKIAAIALLVFVGATVVTLAVKSLSPKHSGAPPADSPATPCAGTESLQRPSDYVMAYYFHSNVRCPTCRTIEALAREAIEKRFAQELKSGQVRWQVLNYEEPAQAPMVQQYGLVAPTVVLVKVQQGQPGQHKNLMRVWEFVDNKQAFADYVEAELRPWLSDSRPDNPPQAGE